MSEQEGLKHPDTVEKSCECQLCFKRFTSYVKKPTCPKCGNHDQTLIEVEEV